MLLLAWCWLCLVGNETFWSDFGRVCLCLNWCARACIVLCLVVFGVAGFGFVGLHFVVFGLDLLAFVVGGCVVVVGCI